MDCLPISLFLPGRPRISALMGVIPSAVAVILPRLTELHGVLSPNPTQFLTSDLSFLQSPFLPVMETNPFFHCVSHGADEVVSSFYTDLRERKAIFSLPSLLPPSFLVQDFSISLPLLPSSEFTLQGGKCITKVKYKRT